MTMKMTMTMTMTITSATNHSNLTMTITVEIETLCIHWQWHWHWQKQRQPPCRGQFLWPFSSKKKYMSISSYPALLGSDEVILVWPALSLITTLAALTPIHWWLSMNPYSTTLPPVLYTMLPREQDQMKYILVIILKMVICCPQGRGTLSKQSCHVLSCHVHRLAICFQKYMVYIV